MNRTKIRVIERASIRTFLEKHRNYLSGRVLDYGCGLPHRCIQPMPYRDLVTGEYVPYDVGYPVPVGDFDSVLCTQVLQLLPSPSSFLTGLATRTTHLVMTYPTLWEEVERDDLWRFTRAGMEHLLTQAGFRVVVHERRWSLPFEDFECAGGYGVVAQSQCGPHHA